MRRSSHWSDGIKASKKKLVVSSVCVLQHKSLLHPSHALRYVSKLCRFVKIQIHRHQREHKATTTRCSPPARKLQTLSDHLLNRAGGRWLDRTHVVWSFAVRFIYIESFLFKQMQPIRVRADSALLMSPWSDAKRVRCWFLFTWTSNVIIFQWRV